MRQPFSAFRLAILFAVCSSIPSLSSMAQEKPAAEKPASFKPTLKDLDGHFPFQVPTSLDAWEKRAAEVRQQLKVTLGVHPAPQLPPLQATVHSPRQMDGYSIEKVSIESIPGLFVTGTLFRPAGEAKGKRPAMLCAWTLGQRKVL